MSGWALALFIKGARAPDRTPLAQPSFCSQIRRSNAETADKLGFIRASWPTTRSGQHDVARPAQAPQRRRTTRSWTVSTPMISRARRRSDNGRSAPREGRGGASRRCTPASMRKPATLDVAARRVRQLMGRAVNRPGLRFRALDVQLLQRVANAGLKRDEARSMNWIAKETPASKLFFSHGGRSESRKSRYTPSGS